jgi:uncharacterized integral membrane protein
LVPSRAKEVLTMSDGGKPDRFRDRDVVVGDSTVNMKVIVGVLILIGVLFFVFQNTEEVGLTWTFFEFEMALWIYTLLMFGLGIVMGWALHLRRTRRKAQGD